MNFNRSGWLKKYIQFRTTNPFPVRLPSSGVKMLETGGHHHQLDEAIYYFLQPTGLLYGFPVGLPFADVSYPGMEYMDAGDRGHLIFLESMFSCMVADRAFLLKDLVDEPDHFGEAISVATDFFTGITAKKKWNLPAIPASLFSKGNSKAERQFEQAIQQRIDGKGEIINISGIYYNSFLFLDLCYCLLYQRRVLMEPDEGGAYVSELGALQVRLRRDLIRTMIAAAMVDGQIVEQERNMVEWFIKSSGLPRREVTALRKEMTMGGAPVELSVPDMPWLVRRFFLEAVMMTVLSDRDLGPEEAVFLRELVEKLELWEDELNQGRLALEVFLLNSEDTLQVLKTRSFVFNVGDNLTKQATLMVRKNLHRITNEIRETQDLYNLLIKSTHTALTSEEKARVRAQITDIFKTIPTLAIFALPGGSLILPILFKLLPFNLLPSSFED